MAKSNVIYNKLQVISLIVLVLFDQTGIITNESNESGLLNKSELRDSSSLTRVKRKHTALDGYEWTQQYRCNQDKNEADTTSSFRVPLSNLWAHLMSDCHKEDLSWRFKYVDELKPSFNHQIKDKTIDERLINIIHGLSWSNMFETNYFIFNSGSSSEDAKNELRVAGPEVDDSKCIDELTIMNNLYDDMQSRLVEFRSANKTTLAHLSLGERHIRLARVLDSFGRYESGSLDGKLQLSGAYDECIGSQLTTDDHGNTKIQMRYCWANMNSRKHLHPLFKSRKRFHYEPDRPTLNVGVCLPKSCHSKSFHQQGSRTKAERLINSQMRLPSSIFVDESLELESVFCLVDNDSEHARIPTSGKLCLLVVALWSLLCVSVTAANRFGNSSRTSDEPNHTKSSNNTRDPFQARVRKCLDLGQAWMDLTSSQRQVDSSSAVNLDVLNPIKVLALCFCVVAHTALMLGPLAVYPLKNAADVDTSVILMAALMSSTIVDTFFVISGMLLTYIWLRKLSQRKRKLALWRETSNQLSLTLASAKVSPQIEIPDKIESRAKKTMTFFGTWFVIALNRYLRLVPLYAIMFWFRRDVLTYLGQGPFWDYGLNQDTASGACMQEPWYMPFTYLSANRQLSKQCFVPTWSVSNDIFFGLFVGPIIVLLVSKPKMAIGSVIALIILSTLAATDAVITLPKEDVWQYLDANMNGIALLFRSLTPLYAYPIYRASAFLVGVLAGYFLYKFENKHLSLRQAIEHSNSASRNGTNANEANWPRWLSGSATLLSYMYLICHLIFSVFSKEFKLIMGPCYRLATFYFLNGDRIVWSMANAVLLLQMMTTWRHNSWMQSFASQKWLTLSKLNYPLLFVHWILVVVYLGQSPAAPVFTLWHIFASSSVILLASLGISAVIHVVIENPIDKLIKREIFGL